MGTLYTPQGGNVMQSQQNSQMMNALASITGSAPAAALGAASQAAPNYGNTPIPQLANREEALRTMFAHDQALAANYANPNLYGGGGAPAGNPAGAFASPLQATIESITNPQGMTTPGAITGAMGNEIGGQMDTLQNVMDAIDFNKTRTDTSYNNMLKFLESIFSEEQANKREAMKINATSSIDEDTVDSYAEQVIGGLNISSIPDKNIRNAVVNKLSSNGWTPDKIKKHIEGKQTVTVLKSVKDLWDLSTSSGIESGGPFGVFGQAKKLAGYAKIEPEVQNYLRYKKGITSTLRGLVGEKGILSNEDMIRIENLLPDYNLSEEQARSAWGKVVELLSAKYGADTVAEYFGESAPSGGEWEVIE